MSVKITFYKNYKKKAKKGTIDKQESASVLKIILIIFKYKIDNKNIPF